MVTKKIFLFFTYDLEMAMKEQSLHLILKSHFAAVAIFTHLTHSFY